MQSDGREARDRERDVRTKRVVAECARIFGRATYPLLVPLRCRSNKEERDRKLGKLRRKMRSDRGENKSTQAVEVCKYGTNSDDIFTTYWRIIKKLGQVGIFLFVVNDVKNRSSSASVVGIPTT